MGILYFDCGMGAAGDMLAAALLELVPERDAVLETLGNLGLPGVSVSLLPAKSHGIAGARFSVTVHGEEEDHCHPHDHAHRTMADIDRLTARLPVSDKVRRDVQNVYGILARAESRVHGAEVSEVHFHEVGALDALADITAVCLLMERLAPERVTASPVHVGFGHVRCAHGTLPVPAPATAEILTGVPVCAGEIQGELCTPTGAALLKYFAAAFGPLPPMTLRAVGYGLGSRDFSSPNCLRAFWGD